MTIAAQIERIIWTVAPSTNTPLEFGRWMGQSEMAANAAMWYASSADMIDYLSGWLEMHGAEDDKRRSAKMLYDQLTQPMDDCASYEEWRYGI